MIVNKVYRLKKDSVLPNGITFKAGMEIEIVMDVIYITGYPLPQEVQGSVYNWVVQNPELFKDDTRDF